MDALTWQVYLAGVVDQIAQSQKNTSTNWQMIGVLVSGTAAIVTATGLIATWVMFYKTRTLAFTEHQASYRIDLQRLLLDINKVMIDKPELLAMCGVKMDVIDHKDKKPTAFGFLLMNTFETVTSYYMNSPTNIKTQEAETWRAWANWLHYVLREVPLSKKILELDKDQCNIFETKFWNFCKAIVDKTEDQLKDLEPWRLCKDDGDKCQVAASLKGPGFQAAPQ